jgi:hypothetical protein
MELIEQLGTLKQPFYIAIETKFQDYFQIIVGTLKYYLANTDNEIVCVTLKHPAVDIFKALETKVESGRLFFVDAISVFTDYGLPAGQMTSVMRPELVNDIWSIISQELVRRQINNQKTIVILHCVAELIQYIDINEALIFLNNLTSQLKEKEVSVIITTGIRDNRYEKDLFQAQMDTVIRV